MAQALADLAIGEWAKRIGGLPFAGMTRHHGSPANRGAHIAGRDGHIATLPAWNYRNHRGAFASGPGIRATTQSSAALGKPEVSLLDRLVEISG